MTTDLERLETELSHLLNLCAPPWTTYWVPYAERKAQILADWDKAYADLPALLAEKLKATESAWSDSGRKARSTTTPRSS